MLSLLLALLPGAASWAQADVTTYKVTLASDSKSTDLDSSHAVYNIPGLGPGMQDTSDTTGNSGDLRWVINRSIIYGGTVKIVFDTTVMINNGSCSALPCKITLDGPLPPLASLYGNAGSSTEVNYTNALSWYGSDATVNRTAPLNLTIDGGAYGNVILDGNNAYRIFFLLSGTYTFKNLILQNAYAKGGDSNAGGGGLGAGAGIFLYQADASQPTSLTLNTVYFDNCKTVGGSSGVAVAYFGGGGLAGDGGFGGGGFWLGSDGVGANYDGGDMAAATDSGGYGLYGTGEDAFGSSAAGFGGGGGAATVNAGHRGGFGGGGGGSFSYLGGGGDGGFGGGGGGSIIYYGGGDGGFGGGGGGGLPNGGGGAFGGAGGSNLIGGGGAALGPAIFVYQGTLNTVNSGYGSMTATGGSGANPGTGLTSPVFQYKATVNGANYSSDTTPYGAMAGALSSDPLFESFCPVGTAASYSLATSPTTLTAGSPADLTVTARDSSNNGLAGYFVGLPSAFTLSSNDNDPGLGGSNGTSASFISCGVTTFSITPQKATDNLSLTAKGYTDAAQSSSITGSLNGLIVNPRAMNQLTLSGPTATTPGTAITVKAIPEDSYGNHTSYTGTVTFSTSDPEASLSPSLSTVSAATEISTQAIFQTPGAQTIQALVGGSSTGSLDITVTPLLAPTVIASFASPSIPYGDSTILTLTLTNSNTVAITGASFSNAYPSGLTAQATNTTCSQTSFIRNPSYFLIAGVSLPANASCTVTTTLTASTPGSYTDHPSAPISVQSGNNVGVATSATLTVTKVVPSLSFTTAPTRGSYGGSAIVTLSYNGDGAVSLTSATPQVCSVIGGGTSYTLNYHGAGACNITASAAEGTRYTAATNVSVDIFVSQATATIQVMAYSTTYDGKPHTATGSVTGVNGADLSPYLVLSGTTHTNAGSYPDAWTFHDPNGNYADAYATLTDTISKATPTVSLWPTASPINYGQILASSTLSGGAALVPGSFAWSAPSTSPSTGTASYEVTFTPTDATDYKIVSGSVSVTTTSTTFIITDSSNSGSIQSVVPGGAASFGLAVKPSSGTFSNAVTFSVSGLPASATAIFSPASIAAGSSATNVTMTVQTTKTTVQNQPSALARGAAPLALALLLLPLAGTRRMRRVARSWLAILIVSAALASTMALTGCGGSFFAQAPKSYNLTITATSGTVIQSHTVILNIQ